MKTWIVVTALTLLGSPAARAETPADLILVGGVVHTLDPSRPRAEAIAVTTNRISAVGTRAEVLRGRGLKTRVIELGGATVVPGLQESHGHLLGIGQQKLVVDLVGTRSFGEVVERVRAALPGRKPGEWLIGRGWHEGKWSEPAPGAVRGFPTHQALSALAPEIPILLHRADGHAVLLNARAMALTGIGPQTAAPTGGEIIRDAAGNPTGVLVDNAVGLVKLPALDRATRGRAIELAIEECLRKGITTFDDAGTDPETLAVYRELASERRLPLRLYVMLAGDPMLRTFTRPELGLGGGLLTIRAVKLYADGALGSRGAALLEPYLDDPANAGLLVTPPEAILAAARYALAHGFQVCVHAIGDRANRLVLDAYQTALGEFPAVKDPRFRIEHAQILDEKDIPRFARLGVIASMQGIHATSDRPWAADRIGIARVTEGAYVWRKLLATGARVINGTDAPVEDVSPLRSFYASITRQDENGQPPEGFDPDQRMTREQALRSYTADAAYGNFEEAQRGQIVAGKLADLTVLSRDIMSVAPLEILKTDVLYTIVDGQVRYQRP